MKLLELLEKVKEENLSKEQLESYRDQLAHLASDIQIQLGTYQKLEAQFMAGRQPDESVAARKIDWKSRPEGQRLVELKNYSTAAKIQLRALRDRLYSIY